MISRTEIPRRKFSVIYIRSPKESIKFCFWMGEYTPATLDASISNAVQKLETSKAGGVAPKAK
jgi:hypothetical protein